MTESIAINVGANTNEPGFRGRIWPDGGFEYIPIPESESTTERVPTYGDLEPHLDRSLPDAVRERPVHLDPEFPEYPFCERYTYGDEHGVKAGRLTSLSAGDYVFFYATLTVASGGDWLPPEWGAFLIGQFRLARDPLSADGYERLGTDERTPLANNAHVKRDPFDARVLLLGDPDASRLFDRAVPLSTAGSGSDPNWLVTDCSTDSGRGPWWRRPLGFDPPGTDTLCQVTRLRPSRVESYQG